MRARGSTPMELRERAVRLTSSRIGRSRMSPRISASTRRRCGSGCARREADSGRRRDLLTSEEREELKRLRKENAELRRANAILKDASVYFARSSTRPGEGDPLRGGAAGGFRGRADLPGVGRAGEHVLRAQIPEAVARASLPTANCWSRSRLRAEGRRRVYGARKTWKELRRRRVERPTADRGELAGAPQEGIRGRTERVATGRTQRLRCRASTRGCRFASRG